MIVKNRTKLILLFGIAAIGLAAAWLIFVHLHISLRAVVDSVFAGIRTLGPGPFFLAMAILPAFGFPLLAFSLSAGPVFGAQLGLPLVSTLVVASIMGNLALTYWLSHYAFHPLLERIVRALGYKLPVISENDHLSMTVMVRVTPGPPFFVQSYLLGLTGVRFPIYMWVSSLIAGTYAVAVVLFGDSLATGRGKLAITAFSCLIVISVAINWIRRRLQQKKALKTT